MLALGAPGSDNKAKHMTIAGDIAHTCHESYDRSGGSIYAVVHLKENRYSIKHNSFVLDLSGDNKHTYVQYFNVNILLLMEFVGVRKYVLRWGGGGGVNMVYASCIWLGSR